MKLIKVKIEVNLVKVNSFEVKKETERHIAVKNGTLNDFKRKWGPFQQCKCKDGALRVH